jgi:hypothetical protein
LATQTHASVPVPVNATFTGGFSVVSSSVADGNTLLIIDNSIQFRGDLQGICVDQTELLIIHPDGSDNFRATCTFAANILGNTGTVTLTFAGNGQGLLFHGDFAIVQGTGQLSNNNVQGVFSGSFTSATTFAGSVSGNSSEHNHEPRTQSLLFFSSFKHARVVPLAR